MFIGLLKIANVNINGLNQFVWPVATLKFETLNFDSEDTKF